MVDYSPEGSGPMNGFDYWSWYTAAVGIGFAVWETAAIMLGKRQWTFTYKIRQWLGIDPVRPWRLPASIAFSMAMVGFTVWFIPHIVLGWWGGS